MYIYIYIYVSMSYELILLILIILIVFCQYRVSCQQNAWEQEQAFLSDNKTNHWISFIDKAVIESKIDISLSPIFKEAFATCIPCKCRQLWSKRDRDVGSMSNLGTRRFEGTFFLKKQGAFPKTKKGTSLFIAKSWGYMPPVPPVSYVY